MEIQDLPADVRDSFLAGDTRSDIPPIWLADPESEVLASAQPDPWAYLAAIQLRQAVAMMKTADHQFELERDMQVYDEVAASVNARYGDFVIRSEVGHGVYGLPDAFLRNAQR